MREIPYFRLWTKRKILNFYCCFERKEFFRGQTIFSEGSPSDYIAIIEKGECEIIKTLPSMTFQDLKDQQRYYIENSSKYATSNIEYESFKEH
jgi:hypothetical protein